MSSSRSTLLLIIFFIYSTLPAVVHCSSKGLYMLCFFFFLFIRTQKRGERTGHSTEKFSLALYMLCFFSLLLLFKIHTDIFYNHTTNHPFNEFWLSKVDWTNILVKFFIVSYIDYQEKSNQLIFENLSRNTIVCLLSTEII